MQTDRDGQLAVGALIGLALVYAGLSTNSPEVLLILALVPLATWIVLDAPFIPVLLFVLLVATRLHEALPGLGKLPIALAMACLGLVAGTWHVGLRRTLPPYFPVEMKWLALLTLSMFASLITSYSRTDSLFILVELWSRVLVGICLLMWLTRSSFAIWSSCIGMLLCGLLISTIAIHGAVFGDSLLPGERVKLAGMIGDPNDLMLMLMGPLGIAVALLWRRVGPWTMLLSAVTIASVLGVAALALSRGSLLGILAVTSVVAYLTGRLRSVMIMVVLVSPVLLLVLAKLMLRGDIVGSDAGGLDASASERLSAWKAAIHMGLTNPFGVGLGNSAAASYDYAFYWERYRSMVTHNTWLETFAEMGTLGLVALVGMIAAAFRSLGECRRILAQANGPKGLQALAVGLTGSLAGYCVAMSFLSQLSGWMLYILVGLSAAFRQHVVTQYGSVSRTAIDEPTLPGSAASSPPPSIDHGSGLAPVRRG